MYEFAISFAFDCHISCYQSSSLLDHLDIVPRLTEFKGVLLHGDDVPYTDIKQSLPTT